MAQNRHGVVMRNETKPPCLTADKPDVFKIMLNPLHYADLPQYGRCMTTGVSWPCYRQTQLVDNKCEVSC